MIGLTIKMRQLVKNKVWVLWFTVLPAICNKKSWSVHAYKVKTYGHIKAKTYVFRLKRIAYIYLPIYSLCCWPLDRCQAKKSNQSMINLLLKAPLAHSGER